jgi:hypothetical protein
MVSLSLSLRIDQAEMPAIRKALLTIEALSMWSRR